VQGNARLLTLDELRLFKTKPCTTACMPMTAADAAAHARLVPHVQPACTAAALPLSVCGAPTLVGLYPGYLSRGRWRLALAQAVCSVASAALAPEAPVLEDEHSRRLPSHLLGWAHTKAKSVSCQRVSRTPFNS